MVESLVGVLCLTFVLLLLVAATARLLFSQ
jgi:hypothetical protein